MPEVDWLGVTIQEIQTDVREIKEDVSALREYRAEIHGKVIMLSAVISVVIGLIGLWLRAH